MKYEHSLYDSIEAISADDWEKCRARDDNPLTDRRYLLALERSKIAGVKPCYAIFRDSRGTPVARACWYLYCLDAAVVASGRVRKSLDLIRKVFPRSFRPRLVCCGLPVTADSGLWLAPETDPADVLPVLDGLLRSMAVEGGAKCIIWKELNGDERRRFELLGDLGYLRFRGPPMNCAPPIYRDFDDLLSRLKSTRRNKIKISLRKFAQSGLTVTHASGRDVVFTDEMYRLYEAVSEGATHKLETLPAAFFREMACQMPDETRFTLIRDNERIVAFAFSLSSGTTYRVMFVGLDYALNESCHLYFNLMFHAMDRAFQAGASRIFVGHSTDMFKREKLGCYSEPYYFCIKGTGRLASWFIRSRMPKLFPEGDGPAGGPGGDEEQ